MYFDNVGLGPCEYLSDCDWVVSSFRKGRCETTGATHACADSWEGVWDRVCDLGGGVAVAKVKGHARGRDDDFGEGARWRRLGNKAA
eukprot:8972702-Pyramimonas_sp.AAC.1